MNNLADKSCEDCAYFDSCGASYGDLAVCSGYTPANNRSKKAASKDVESRRMRKELKNANKS